nr:aprataxin and PNK-like factor isoform X3 [Cherax quadricarinatus]XP_053651715.1 aprataxin and PNK-like factor isoform X3 [Cherax quadricarinatus]
MRIALVRVKDPDDSDVELSDEEILITQPVVLGRGSLLKCGEKKISRRHAYLDVEDNGVRITSVHQSPTFVIVNGSEQQLNVGTSALLSHGDKFGLMKTHFWYK